MISAYNGSEPYIFVSYAHKDSKEVFSTIEQLTSLGYRVWYDEGIRPGVEWPENIAVHLDRCSLFMMFISRNSMESANCRREINFALSRSKPFLCIVLEDTEIPLGMELQLASQQSIFKYHYASEKEYMVKVCSAAGMAACKDTHYFAESRPELARMDSHLSGSAGSSRPADQAPAGRTAVQKTQPGSGTSGNMSGSGGSFDQAPAAQKSQRGGTSGKSAAKKESRRRTSAASGRQKSRIGHPVLLIGIAAAAILIVYLLMRTVLGGAGTSALTPTPTPTATPTPTISAGGNAGGGTTAPAQTYDTDQDGEPDTNYPGEDTADDNQTTDEDDENNGYYWGEMHPDDMPDELVGQSDTDAAD